MRIRSLTLRLVIGTPPTRMLELEPGRVTGNSQMRQLSANQVQHRQRADYFVILRRTVVTWPASTVTIVAISRSVTSWSWSSPRADVSDASAANA